MNKMVFPRHTAEIAAVVRAMLVVVAVCATARTAAADDCYRVKQGTQLYAEVMAETAVGEATTDAIGWFGIIRGDDPSISLRFVALDRDVLMNELYVYVKKEEATPVTCPRAWRRDGAAMVELTWPDARHAGSAVPRAIAVSLRTTPKKQGRACFPAAVPGVAATVCAPRDDQANKAACVAIPAGRDVYARASRAAKLGTTTKQVVARVNAAVDDVLAVTALDEHESFATYVRSADTKPAQCPARRRAGASLGQTPFSEALLPDGRDAGFRTDGPDVGANTTEVVVRGRTLQCFDHVPMTGLQLRVCIGSGVSEKR